MPSSLIIVGLVAAWLVVLVPMIARKRQEIARTNDSALSSRVVRSGDVPSGRREEFAMSVGSEADGRDGAPVDDRMADDELHDDYVDDEDEADVDDYDEYDYRDEYRDSDEYDEEADFDEPAYAEAQHTVLAERDRFEVTAVAEPADDVYPEDAPGYDAHDSYEPHDSYDDAAYDSGYDEPGYDEPGYDPAYDSRYDEAVDYEEWQEYERTEPRRYRPGRGGFDPEAAAIAARAKYTYRQRVVLAMLIAAVLSAVLAVTVRSELWWAHGGIDLLLVGYLGYLRRQVRLEEEIRQRRLARMERVRRVSARRRAAAPPPAQDGGYEYATQEHEDDEESHADAVERRPVPRPSAPRAPEPRPGTVVVDVDDEDPAFDELGEPGSAPYRRAVGE